MIYLILDIFFYNYTSFKTCLFLLNVNNKNILYNIIIGLFIYIFITHTYGVVTLYMLGISIVIKYINMYNVLVYYLVNLGIIYLFYNKTMFVVSSLFILISYINKYKYIKLIG